MVETSKQFSEELLVLAAAQKYNLTPGHLAKLARNHTIRARKFGRDWIIDEASLRDYLTHPRQKPGPKSGKVSLPEEKLVQPNPHLHPPQTGNEEKQHLISSEEDWLEKIILLLRRAVEAEEISEEACSAIITQLRHERHLQALSRRAVHQDK